ncbi:hypothetical protein DFH94DRAFT_687081 [Russula ochroleuca]|uniref:DNAJ-containing protein X-domain domain-containing protein n=1 Tax=Russula ochroleuca TaxID=152965 RepID=A0A9P5MMS8_9AGAM|nr:hypothetical protein DFH94DRAFT_687081 [Russula ochroleuca]
MYQAHGVGNQNRGSNWILDPGHLLSNGLVPLSDVDHQPSLPAKRSDFDSVSNTQSLTAAAERQANLQGEARQSRTRRVPAQWTIAGTYPIGSLLTAIEYNPLFHSPHPRQHNSLILSVSSESESDIPLSTSIKVSQALTHSSRSSATLTTIHLFNAVPQLHHRDPSNVGLLGASSHISALSSPPPTLQHHLRRDPLERRSHSARNTSSFISLVATRSGDVLCSKNYEDPNDRHRLPVAFRPQALYKYDEFGPKEGVSGGGFIDVFGDLRKVQRRKIACRSSHRLGIFTENATGVNDPEVTGSWRRICSLEAEKLKGESYGVELLYAIGFVYSAKAKLFLAANQSFFGVGRRWLTAISTCSLRLLEKKHFEESGRAAEKGLYTIFKRSTRCYEGRNRVLNDPALSRNMAILRTAALQILWGICSYDLVGNATSAKPRPERADFALDLGKAKDAWKNSSSKRAVEVCRREREAQGLSDVRDGISVGEWPRPKGDGGMGLVRREDEWQKKWRVGLQPELISTSN